MRKYFIEDILFTTEMQMLHIDDKILYSLQFLHHNEFKVGYTNWLLTGFIYAVDTRLIAM